jgi:hypothetical protein
VIEFRENERPSLFVAEARGFVGEASVSEVEVGTGGPRSEFDGDDCFEALRGGGHPSHFDEAVGGEAQEAPIVRIALAFEKRFEEERSVDFGLHDDGTWSGEPAVELLGPGEVESVRGSEHVALAVDMEGAGGEIRRRDDGGHSYAWGRKNQGPGTRTRHYKEPTYGLTS